MTRGYALSAAWMWLVVATAASAAPIAFYRPETASAVTLDVRVPSAKAGALSNEFSGYGRNHSPAIAWSGAPAGVKSFALFVEDPQDGDPAPLIHWVAWNIAPTLDSLPHAIRNERELKRPLGMRQAENSHGGIGWTGPHPPVGAPAQPYHVQIFALDRMLKLGGGADREAVLRAIRGHVLARGETIVTYAEPAPKPAPAPAT